MNEPTSGFTAALAGRYRIERQIGAGGMATVFLARDVKHDRDVALKVLRPELAAVLGADRFLNEVRITARLEHPHIVTLIDSGETDGFLWYVLPFIRGESLRDRLEREKQLDIDEALRITRQVAGALEYAHRQGVVHRDIKPENILLHEGEAMLADFGIALAVKEAGGNRLTETGLSLGTPQYMSPEQATGDRKIDARSDLYSLAAVLYEMLAGEPPHSGATVQAIIAKLMTERPTRLRTVRDTVPEVIDAAVARALAKIPADRFHGVADFSRALEAAGGAPAQRDAPSRRRVMVTGVVLGVVAVAVLGVWLGTRVLGERRGPAVVLRDRTQLTTSAGIRVPALSPDGKQLAYVTRDCGAGGCAYAVELQDVGGTTTRRVVTGATAAYGLIWSPDRRNLVFVGSFGGRYGNWLLSALGGSPRFLSAGEATFTSGGDSVLTTPTPLPDSVFWIRVATLDGVPRDSIRVSGPADGVVGLTVVPDSRWIVAALRRGPTIEWRALDRTGRVSDRVTMVGRYTTGLASRDAVWISGGTDTDAQWPIFRVGFDPRSGTFATRHDTLYAGTFTGWSVTRDGDAFVVDEGTNEFSVWALELGDALRGRFTEGRRLLRASSNLFAVVSPGGERLAIRKVTGSAAGTAYGFTTIGFAGGPETPLALPPRTLGWYWIDAATVALAERTDRGVRFGLLDVASGARRGTAELSDTSVRDFTRLPDSGWAWIPSDGQSIQLRSGDAAATRTIAIPAWYQSVGAVNAAPDGERLAYVGWNAATYDSAGLSVVTLADGRSTRWATAFSERLGGSWMADGSLLFHVWEGAETYTAYRVPAPGRMERIGTIPRSVYGVSVSKDRRRAAITVQDYRADAWMSRVAHR